MWPCTSYGNSIYQSRVCSGKQRLLEALQIERHIMQRLKSYKTIAMTGEIRVREVIASIKNLRINRNHWKLLRWFTDWHKQFPHQTSHPSPWGPPACATALRATVASFLVARALAGRMQHSASLVGILGNIVPRLSTTAIQERKGEMLLNCQLKNLAYSMWVSVFNVKYTDKS